MRMRAGIDTHPVVLRISSLLCVNKYEALGRIYGLASWWAVHSECGLMKREFGAAIDHMLGGQGALDILCDEGWIVARGGAYSLARFCNAFTRKTVSKSLRDDVLAAGQCSACGSRFKLVVDHIIPVSRGGKTTRENLQALCDACNAAKGTKTMGEFLEIRARA